MLKAYLTSTTSYLLENEKNNTASCRFMENYNIYDEIGRGTHSFVYKARRKRSIEYVAVKSTAKSRMDKILNEVPFLHKLDSPRVLKFFDWYESSNHIWLVLEYCMGGDLLNLITQDKQLPESTIQSFGIELVAGLQYLHTNSILYCDMKPANILIDEFGSLKLADFGLARRIPGQDATPARSLAPGSPHYMAPELFQQPTVHSFASDFWALGCVLYELRTGRQPFTHTNFSELARMIQTEPVKLPAPRCEMSPAFCNLLEQLLVKDPYQRISWDELLDHPFWSDVPQLEKKVMPRQEEFERYASVSLPKRSDSTFKGQRDHWKDMPLDHIRQRPEFEEYPDDNDNNFVNKTRAVGGQKSQEMTDIRNVINLDSKTLTVEENSSANFDTNNEIKTGSAPSIQHLSQQIEINETDDDMNDLLSDSCQMAELRHCWRDLSTPHITPPVVRSISQSRLQLYHLFNRLDTSGSGTCIVSKLIFTAADCHVQSIIELEDIQIGEMLRVQVGLFQFPVISPKDLLSCSAEALEIQLTEIYDSLKSAPDHVKLSVLAYLFSLSCHARLAHIVVNSSILKLLVHMVTVEARQATPNKSAISILCLVLSILFHFATSTALSSPDQIHLLVASLLRVIHAPLKNHHHNLNASEQEMQPRPLALACLGELLSYMSTQHEWNLPMEGVKTILVCLEDADFAIRLYAVRAFNKMLIHCTDALRVQLISQANVLTLMRGLMQYVTNLSSLGSEERSQIIALQTATTEALAQVLRHLRTFSSVALFSSRLKRSVVLFFAKPDILHAIWRNVENFQVSAALAIASINIINVFLEIKLSTGSEAEAAAIKASRTLLVDRVIAFPTILKILQRDDTDAGDKDEFIILQAKCLNFICLSVRVNQGALVSFVQYDTLNIIESIVSIIADKLCDDEGQDDLESPETRLSINELYLTQCAINVCKLSVLMAVNLGTIYCNTHKSGENEATSYNDVEVPASNISPIPFQLFESLVRNPNCRQQFLKYLLAEDSKQYAVFLRLMARLLTSFPHTMISISWSAEKSKTIAQYVLDILTDLFESAGIVSNDIILVEQQLIFRHLMPAVLKHLHGETANNDNILAIACLRLLHVILLDFDYTDNNDEFKFYNQFIRLCFIPHINALITSRKRITENIWQSMSELLYKLLFFNSSLLREIEEVNLVPTIIILLQIPADFQSLPSYATKLVQMLLTSNDVRLELLYESGVATSMITSLTFALKHKILDETLLSLMVILLTLLDKQYKSTQQPEPTSTPVGYSELVLCGPIMLHICAWSGQEISPESATTDKCRKEELADLASRCLMLLSQDFGEEFNKIMFNQHETLTSELGNSILSSLITCLQVNMNGVILLRVLLTLKNCVRCKNNNFHGFRWLSENRRVISLVEVLASQQQSSRISGIQSNVAYLPNRPSIAEQVSKSAAAIIRLCKTSRLQ